MGNPFSKATEDPGNECPKSSSSTPNDSSPRMDSSAPTSMNIFDGPIVPGDSDQFCGKPANAMPGGDVQPGLNKLASAKPPQLQVVPLGNVDAERGSLPPRPTAASPSEIT